MGRRFPILPVAVTDLGGCAVTLVCWLIGAGLIALIPSLVYVIFAFLVIGSVVAMVRLSVKSSGRNDESYALVDEEGVLVQTLVSSRRLLHKEIAYVSHRLPDEENKCFYVEIALYGGEIIKIATHRENVSLLGGAGAMSRDSDTVGASLTLTIRELRSECLRRVEEEEEEEEEEEALPASSNLRVEEEEEEEALPASSNLRVEEEEEEEEEEAVPASSNLRVEEKAIPPSSPMVGSEGIEINFLHEHNVKDAVAKALRAINRLRKRRGGFSSPTAAREFHLSNAAIPNLGTERIIVGVDGVLFGCRFIPHADIQAIYHQTAGRKGYAFLGASLKWVVMLQLKSGEFVDLRIQWVPEGAKDARGAELTWAINEAFKAWSVAQRDARSQGEMLARGKRTGAEWLQGLRELLRGNGPVYRTGHVHKQDLANVLDDAGAMPSARAAAAVALAASGDKTSAPKLRIAAESMADPRVHLLLEKVADASDDEAVIEALAALEEEEHALRTRRL